MNSAQNDLLLDVYEACVLVAEAHEQWECHKSSGKKAFEAAKRQAVEKAVSGQYKEAVGFLCEVYHHALAEGVDEDRLDHICEKYLPDGIVILNGEVQL